MHIPSHQPLNTSHRNCDATVSRGITFKRKLPVWICSEGDRELLPYHIQGLYFRLSAFWYYGNINEPINRLCGGNHPLITQRLEWKQGYDIVTDNRPTYVLYFSWYKYIVVFNRTRFPLGKINKINWGNLTFLKKIFSMKREN